MLFLTYLSVLCKRYQRLFLQVIFFPVPGNLYPVPDFIQPVYLCFVQLKAKGCLHLFDDSFHGQFFSRYLVAEAAIGISFPFACQVGSSQKTETRFQ